jgi:hypothetical protein
LFDAYNAAALAVTFDGGFSWVARPAPEAVAGMTLSVLDARTIALRTETGRWYLSTDTGRSYAQTGSEPARPATGPPPATPPPLAGAVDVRAGPDGRYWAVEAQADGALHSAASTDGGRTWRALPAVGGPGEETGLLAVGLAGDAWLLTGTDHSVGHAWRFADDRWEPVAGGPDLGLVTSAVPVGQGVLLAATTSGVRALRASTSLVGPGGPARVVRVALLPDGTVHGWSRTPAVAYLCTCQGTSARWVMISLTATV